MNLTRRGKVSRELKFSGNEDFLVTTRFQFSLYELTTIGQL